MKNKNFGRKRQAIYILSNRKSTRIIKTLMDFFFFIKVKIKMVCFSVPSYLMGWEEPEPQSSTILNKKDEKDIAKRLEQTLDQLESDQDGLMFSGEPLDDETRELLKASLQNSITIAKINAKQKS